MIGSPAEGHKRSRADADGSRAQCKEIAISDFGTAACAEIEVEGGEIGGTVSPPMVRLPTVPIPPGAIVYAPLPARTLPLIEPLRRWRELRR